ncbi:hypothetical protein [Kineococcus terrestris]|uniref:hypothetical protein n=1 Tax=Kineococcus terrestris TaxID=2044856 RepID=UPI0034DAC00A
MATTASDVLEPVKDHLEVHLSAFLPPDLPLPALWRTLPDPDRMDTVSYPAVAVATNGTSGEFQRRGRVLEATWPVVVAVWVQSYGYDETTTAVHGYVAALRDCLRAAVRTDWRLVREDYTDLTDPDHGLTLGGGRVFLNVTAPLADPPALTEPPGASLPVLTQHSTTVTPKE